MRHHRTAIRLAMAFALAFSFSAAFAAEPDAAPAPLRRFALVMGVSSGGSSTQRLRYAASDARSFAALMTELGGVDPDDLVLLIEPGLSSFTASAVKLRAASAAAMAEGRRCEFIFYYSGHSDETGLLLGREKLGYAQLRSVMEGMPAAVKIAVLDSCSSGSLTRAKGGSARPAFLFDSSSVMEGHAYITSSSEAEAAQESDSIGGSFFTHHLVSALRGAADTRGEGRVTINDAYAYAYRKTLASTEDTKYGPQHAAYEINLTGKGDLVLTDLRTARAIMAFEPGVSGSLFVRDAKGKLAAELDKAAGERMEVGLPPGAYSIALTRGSARFQAEANVTAGGRTTLSEDDFRAVAATATRARGASAGEEISIAGYPAHLDTTLLPDFSRGIFSSEDDRSVAIGLLWSSARNISSLQASTLSNFDSGDTRGFQLGGLSNAVAGNSSGLQLAGVGNFTTGDAGGVQASGVVNWTGGKARGAQLSLVNLASAGFIGIQMASAVNVSGNASKGVQLGMVNIANELAGSQIGIVNVSNKLNGFPIGLVNIEKGGILGVQAWWDTGNNARVAFQFGTRTAYTILNVGIGLEAGADPLSVGMGFGVRLPLGFLGVDMDLCWRSGWSQWGATSWLEGRVLAALPAKKAGIIVGFALDGFVPGLTLDSAGMGYGAFTLDPRFMVGVKF